MPVLDGVGTVRKIKEARRKQDKAIDRNKKTGELVVMDKQKIGFVDSKIRFQHVLLSS